MDDDLESYDLEMSSRIILLQPTVEQVKQTTLFKVDFIFHREITKEDFQCHTDKRSKEWFCFEGIPLVFKKGR